MSKKSITKRPCDNCGLKRKNFPMTYRGEIFCSDNCRKALGLDNAPNSMNSILPLRIDGITYTIMPASCRCGGSFAWFKQRSSGAWESVGCVCHHTPTGNKAVVSPPYTTFV